MDKIRIGIPLVENNPFVGGAYSFYDRLAEAIDNYQFDERIEIVFLRFIKPDPRIKFQKKFLHFDPFERYDKTDFFRKILIETIRHLPFNLFADTLERAHLKHLKKRNANISARLKKESISLLYFLTPWHPDPDYPFVSTHWDIGHYSTFSFPELINNGEFESREKYYRNLLPKAFGIFCETESGRKELINYMSLNPEKVMVAPLFPGKVVEEIASSDEQQNVLSKFGLKKNQFLIYPAQFWAHKNHILLIDALKKIHLDYPELKLIFTGSDKGNLQHVKNYIEKNNLNNKIEVAGFVTNQELFIFYKNALAMAMPTFLGPSNMPPLEAACLGCPVLISDLEGHRELLSDYAVYFDPTNVDDFIRKLTPFLKGDYVPAVFKNKSKFSVDTTIAEVEKYFLKIIPILKNWN